MNFAARLVVARFLRTPTGGPRSFFARREAMPDLYQDLQKHFLKFERTLFSLASLAEALPDPHERDKALDLISDTPTLLDETIGMPNEEVAQKKYAPGLAEVTKGLDELEKLLLKGIEALPPKQQKAPAALLKSRIKVVRPALTEIVKYLDKAAPRLVKMEELRKKEEAKKQKAEEKAKKDLQKEEANWSWCEENCTPCKDSGYGDDEDISF